MTSRAGPQRAAGPVREDLPSTLARMNAGYRSGAGFGQNGAMSKTSDMSQPEPRDTLGRPLRDLRISLLDQCNFRCPYCMPEAEFHADYEFLKRSQRLTHDEIVRIAASAVRLGVSKLRLTGGEPLLDKRVVDLVGRLATIAGVDDLALTTNAMLLAPLAGRLADAGLQRVTISLDSLDEAVFRNMSGGRGDIDTVLKGIEAAEQAGLAPIKINTVVQRGVNDHTVLELLEHFRSSGHIVRLIEYMDVGNRNNWRKDQVVPSREVLDTIHARWPLRPVDPSYRGEVARRYQYLDGAGEIGFISSVTEPFCGTCSRARLSADGMLYTCLFATLGTSLRDPLRSGVDDAGLDELLANVWIQRTDRYSETRQPVEPATHVLKKVEMYRVGG